MTCTTATLMPPTVVDSATCPVGTTVGPGPDYIVTHCVKQEVSAPVDVAACTASDSGPPDYVVTTCGFVSTDTPVLSCVPGPLPDEGVDTVTCVKPAGPNNAGPTQVATCTAQDPTDPNYVKVTCAGPTTTAPVGVVPASCPDGTYVNPTYILTCATSPAGPYPTATPVASCTPGTDASFITTTCTYPPANNYAGTPVAPCTEGTTTDGVTQVQTTCSKTDSGEVYVATASCTPVAQTGTGPAVTCTTTPTSGTPAWTCTAGSVDPGPYFDTTTACHPTITVPMADYAGVCTAGPTATPGEIIDCNLRPIDVLVADSGCVAGTDAGTGLVTQCTTASGSGHQYTVVTTKTVTTTPYSGAVASGADSVVTTSAAPALVDGVCYPTAQALIAPTFPPNPPVDIGGCGAWPCTEITATAGGSQNSLADVAQYYYKTDLRPSMANDVPSAGPNPEDDNAPHQHMTTFTIALGVSGTLNYRPDYRSLATTTGDFADIRTGVKNWPLWPDPVLDYSNPDNYNNPKSIDDFWHTAVNGRGTFFSANNPTSVVHGLGDSLAKIDSVLAAGAPIGTSTLQPVSGDNFAYATSYLSGTGTETCRRSTIDLVTGAPSAAGLVGQGSARHEDRRRLRQPQHLRPAGQQRARSDFTWNTDICAVRERRRGRPYRAERDREGLLRLAERLDPEPVPVDDRRHRLDGATAHDRRRPGNLVNFLRGQRGFEDFETDSLTKLYRHREAVLGDIVDSQPVFVQVPFANTGRGLRRLQVRQREPHADALRRRQRRHAACVLCGPECESDPQGGKEAWAVIPSSVLPNMYKLADENYKNTSTSSSSTARRSSGTSTTAPRRMEDDPRRRPQRRRQGLLRARRHDPGCADAALGIQDGSAPCARHLGRCASTTPTATWA